MNEYGQSSLKKVEEVKKPTLVSDLNFKVASIACGYYHTAIISSKVWLYKNNGFLSFRQG